MGRIPRYTAPDTVYHVICRGNNRQVIFTDNRDYFRYLELWRKYIDEMGFEIYAYALMPNHVHWLIKTGLTPLPEIVHRVHSTYARWFNHIHERVGHLFQGRYKANVCNEDSYLLTLARYIHLNPVKAGLVKKIYQYPWSSYPSYCGRDDPLVNTTFLLKYFNPDIQKARSDFVKFTLKSEVEAIETTCDAPQIVDSKSNPKNSLQKEKRQLRPPSELMDVYQAFSIVSGNKNQYTDLDHIAVWIENNTGVSLSELRGHSRKGQKVLARELFIRIAVGEAGIKRSQVAKYLNKDRSLVTKTLEKWSLNNVPPPAVELLQRFRSVIQQFNTRHHSPR